MLNTENKPLPLHGWGKDLCFPNNQYTKFTFPRRFLGPFTLSPSHLGSWPSTGTVDLLVAHRNIRDSMAALPTGFLTHLCPLKGCRKGRLQLSRHAVRRHVAPCSLANGFPICKYHTIQRLLKPIMEEKHSEEPKYPFCIRCLLMTIPEAYQVAITSWKSKRQVTNITKSCRASTCCAKQIPAWFLIHQNTSALMYKCHVQCVIQQMPAQLRSHAAGSQHWVTSFSWPTTELWQQPHLLFSRNQASFRKQVSVTKNTPTHGLHKAPCCTEGPPLVQS